MKDIAFQKEVLYDRKFTKKGKRQLKWISTGKNKKPNAQKVLT